MVDFLEIRPIKKDDNNSIATIIKNTLIEYDGDKPGTAFYDKSLDNMFDAYNREKTIYFVALLNNVIIGGCGINTLDNDNSNTCELQKMYLSPQARGRKIGKNLLIRCVEFAKNVGFEKCYIETFPQMKAAISLYKMNGFKNINHSMGNTGHNACNIWMLKELNL
jgi:putative acetyltransferase